MIFDSSASPGMVRANTTCSTPDFQSSKLLSFMPHFSPEHMQLVHLLFTIISPQASERNLRLRSWTAKFAYLLYDRVRSVYRRFPRGKYKEIYAA